MSAGSKVPVDVEGRTVVLSNLDKVLYPAAGAPGFTKAQVIDHYTRLAPVLLPHLRDRALTLKRYPNGVDGHSFYEKNAPRGRPEWVRTERLPAPGSTKARETIDYVVVDDLPTLVWVANTASLELHTPQWRIAAAPLADQLVLDLDPGAPAGIVECCAVALLLRELVTADGLVPVAKTSGSKGLQLYAAVSGATSEQTSAYARGLAQRLEREHPRLVVSQMTKALRPGKVLVDWSQNNGSKTTVSVYSLRARARPTVSAPVSWDEVVACADGAADLVFESPDVLTRVAREGDLFAPLLRAGPTLP